MIPIGVAGALGCFGADAETAVSALIEASSDGDNDVRKNFASALADIAEDLQKNRTNTAIPVLEKAETAMRAIEYRCIAERIKRSVEQLKADKNARFLIKYLLITLVGLAATSFVLWFLVLRYRKHSGLHDLITKHTTSQQKEHTESDCSHPH